MTAYPITVDQLEDGHALILGTTGSGKTYQLRGMLEQLRRADRRVGAIDKLGNHWGLTLDADGEAAGLDFIIFGGKRAQVPMTPAQGYRLGTLFVERNIPAIFDVSQWKREEQEAWVADFADAVFETNSTALHLALDEAQSWVPQAGGGDAFRSIQRLAEQGRGNGIRLLMSCQRLSRLDATVRGMAHLVVAMRQTGVLDRRAVKELISASPSDAALIERDLPKMPVGTGYVWSAGEAELQRIAFPANATFDSSRTPRHGDTPPAPIAVSSALVDELRAALAPTSRKPKYPDDTVPADPDEAYAKGGDVAAMLLDRDRRIAQLEAIVADQDAQLQRLSEIDRECDDYNAGLTAIEQLVLAVRSGAWRDASGDHGNADLHSSNANSGAIPDLETTPVRPKPGVGVVAAASSTGSVVHRSDEAAVDSGSLPPRRARILAAIAWSAAYLKRPSVSRGIVAWIADTSAASSSYANDLGAMRTAGLIDYPAPGELALTGAGRYAAPVIAKPRTRDALWQSIAAKLPPRQIAIVEALMDGAAVDREPLAVAIGASATSSSYANDLGRLRTLGLIDYPAPGQVTLGELLR